MRRVKEGGRVGVGGGRVMGARVMGKARAGRVLGRGGGRS